MSASDRAPIVLLHDSLGSVELWGGFPRELAQATSRSVIAYDRIGFGRSSPRYDRTSAALFRQEAADFFPAYLAELRIERFILFGHSVGGGMSLAIAALNPDGCEAVITESAQAMVEPRTLAAIRAARNKFGDQAEFAKLVRWHGEKARWVLDNWTELWLAPQFGSWNIDQYAQQVTCPVLAIHGDADEFGSVEFPRRIASQVAGPAEIALLERCGHVPHREHRQRVVSLVSSFLQRQLPLVAASEH